MTAKEKAKELFNKFYAIDSFYDEIDGGTARSDSKECAIISVKEILELGVYWIDSELQKSNPIYYPITGTEEFWLEVKKEIELL